MTITKSTIKDLLTILAIEVLTAPVVIMYFKFIEPKKLAAVFAASTFVITGFAILKITRRWKDAYASFVYWAIHIHIFVFAIPMLVARVAFWQKPFEDVRFLYFSGPEYHLIAQKVYAILVLGTLVDILVHSLKQKRLARKKDATEKKTATEV